MARDSRWMAPSIATRSPQSTTTMGMPGMGEGGGPANKPQQHAFVMLGRRTLFLCHLTMFHWEEHMYQFVIETTLPDWAMLQYREERDAHPQDSYFIGNSYADPMTVPELASGVRRCFLADIFRGIPYRSQYTDWPWNGIEPVIRNVPVGVDRVVHYRPFAKNMNFPETLTYILFGRGNEAHMTNYQTKEPDFDQILSLGAVPSWLPPSQLEAGVIVDVPGIPRAPANGPVHCTNPLPEGEHMVRYRGDGAPLPIAVGHTYWFCTKIINEVNPCPDCTIPCGSQP